MPCEPVIEVARYVSKPFVRLGERCTIKQGLAGLDGRSDLSVVAA